MAFERCGVPMGEGSNYSRFNTEPRIQLTISPRGKVRLLTE